MGVSIPHFMTRNLWVCKSVISTSPALPAAIHPPLLPPGETGAPAENRENLLELLLECAKNRSEPSPSVMGDLATDAASFSTSKLGKAEADSALPDSAQAESQAADASPPPNQVFLYCSITEDDPFADWDGRCGYCLKEWYVFWEVTRGDPAEAQDNALPPSAGALVLVMILRLLQRFPLSPTWQALTTFAKRCV